MSEKPNSTKQRIQEVALKLFHEKGFENVTINEICKQSGASKNTFYYYFQSKDELFKQYYEISYDIDDENLLRIFKAGSPTEQLWESLRPMVDHINVSGIEIVRQLFIKNVNQDVGTFRVNPKMESVRQIQLTLIEKAQQKGEIRTDDTAENILTLLHQSVIGGVFMWAVSGGKLDFIEIARITFEITLGLPDSLRVPHEKTLHTLYDESAPHPNCE